MQDQMNKTERLGCLYLTFLNHPSGISFGKLKDLLPIAYQGEEQSARRKFERDKDELKLLGMELKCLLPGDFRDDGSQVQDYIYVPAEEIRRMPDFILSEEEATALSRVIFSAMSKLSDSDDEHLILKNAAEKILYRNPELYFSKYAPERNFSYVNGSSEDLATIGLVHDALSKSKKIEFSYHEEKRIVDGRGLISHRGRWCLVASLSDSDEIRHFYIDEMKQFKMLKENVKKISGFDIRNYLLHPLAIRIHEFRDVLLTVSEDREDAVSDFLSGLPKSGCLKKDVSNFSFKTSNQEALFSWLLRNPGSISSIGPDSMHADYIKYLNEIKAYYK